MGEIDMADTTIASATVPLTPFGILHQDIMTGVNKFTTNYQFWVQSRGLYKSPGEQALAMSIADLVT